MREMIKVSVDPKRLIDALVTLRADTETGNTAFRERVRSRAQELGYDAGVLLQRLGATTIKTMKSGSRRKQTDTLPQPLAVILFIETGIDVTTAQSIQQFSQIDFGINLRIDVLPENPEPEEPDAFHLKSFVFEIQEAHAVGSDPSDRDVELDLRIGFDKLRLSINAPGLKVASNRICAETPKSPEEIREPDYSGWFTMKLVSREYLSWVFTPKEEGGVLANRVDADELVRIQTDRDAQIVAELTAARESLKVRVVRDSEKITRKSVAEEHRNKMCAALAKRSINNGANEYVVARKAIRQAP